MAPFPQILQVRLEGTGSPPCGPCRSPRRAASPCSAPAPSPASPHGSPSPSASPAHLDRREQSGRQPPAGCSGRWGKAGEPSLGHPSAEGRGGQVPAGQRFQDIPGEAMFWWPGRSLLGGGSPHTITKTRGHPSQPFSGQLALGQCCFGLDRHRGLCWKPRMLRSRTSGPQLLGSPRHHRPLLLDMRTGPPAHLLLDFLQL